MISPEWFPYYISANKGLVQMVKSDIDSISLPFFDVAAQELIERVAPSSLKDLSIESFISHVKESNLTPSGFIFHVSRCGSTLVSNALRSSGNSVLSEAQPLSVALMALKMSNHYFKGDPKR